MRRTGKAGLILLLAGGLSAGGLHRQRLRQFAPTRPKDAKDAAHILLQGEQKVLAFLPAPTNWNYSPAVFRRLHHLGNSITVVDCSEDDSRYSQDQAPAPAIWAERGIMAMPGSGTCASPLGPRAKTA